MWSQHAKGIGVLASGNHLQFAEQRLLHRNYDFRFSVLFVHRLTIRFRGLSRNTVFSLLNILQKRPANAN
jgi:hypothetical protein